MIRSRKTIALLLQVFVVVIATGFIVYGHIQSHRDAIISDARSFSGHARQSLIASRVFLESVRREVLAKPDLFQDFSQEFADRWALAANELPQVRSVNLVSADGILVNDFVVRGARPIDLSDREYHIRHRQGDRSLVITDPIFSRARNSWFFGMAEGVYTAEGAYLGSVILGIEPDFFVDFYEGIGANKINIVLLGSDNVISAARMVDDLDPPIGVRMDGAPDLGRTSLSAPDLLGTGLTSHLPIRDWPLTVLVHRPLPSVLESLYTPILGLLVLSGLSIFVIFGLIGRLQQNEQRLSQEQRKLIAARDLLASQLELDPLTKVKNRLGLKKRAEILESQNPADLFPAMVLALDIDHFKKINDTYGHASGDEALRQFAAACGASIRGEDVLARLGGEEFAILLPGTRLSDATAIAEKIRQRTEALQVFIDHEDGLFSFTVSIGLAEWTRGEPLNAAIERADDALYTAKRSGRNRVEIAPSCAAGIPTDRAA